MTEITTEQLQNAATDAKNLETVVNGPDDGEVTLRSGRIVKTIPRVLKEATEELALPNIRKGIVDAVPDPMTVGTGDQFSTLTECYNAIDRLTFTGGFRQDVIPNGTTITDANGTRHELEVTSEDALAVSGLNGRYVTIQGERYQAGRFRNDIDDIPRIFRDTPTGDFFTPPTPYSTNVVGNTVVPADALAEVMARVEQGIAWARSEMEKNRKTILRCTSVEGLMQTVHPFGAIKNCAIVNEHSAGAVAILSGQRGVELNGHGGVFFDGCYWLDWDVVFNSVAGGGIHFGALNDFYGCKKVLQGQYNWAAGYTDYPGNNADTGLPQASTPGSGNIVAFGENYVRAKGDGGSLYIPNAFVTGMYGPPLDIDAVGYVNATALFTRDNLRGCRFLDVGKIVSKNSRFGETMAEGPVHMLDSRKLDANGSMIYGGGQGWDLSVDDYARVIDSLTTPTSDGSGTAAPAATRIRRRGFSTAMIENEKHVPYNIGRGNGQQAELYRVNTYNPAVNNRPAPDPVVGAWYATADNTGENFKRYFCVTKTAGWKLEQS